MIGLDATESSVLQHRLAMYEHLASVYPQQHKYMQHQIEILLQLQRSDEAELLLMKLQKLLRKNGLNDKALQAEAIREHLSEQKHQGRFYSVPFLHLASGRFMQRALHYGRKISVKSGDYLIRFAEQDEQMFLVLDGELAVWTRDETGAKHLEHLLHAGEVIGELAFLDGSPRNADVLACKDSSVLAIASKEVLKLFLEQPKVEAALREEATVRKVQVALKKNMYLARLPTYLQRILAKSGSFVYANTLDRLFVCGDHIDSVDLVCAGYVRLVGENRLGESRVMESLKAGSLLGCSAVIPQMQTTYMTDVVCMADTTLIRFSLAAFRQVLEHSPMLYQALFAQAEAAQTQLVHTIHLDH